MYLNCKCGSQLSWYIQCFSFFKKILIAVNDLKNTLQVFCKIGWLNQFMGVVLFENHSVKIIWDLSMTQGKLYTF